MKRKSPIQSKEDFEDLMAQEVSLYYLSFLGDAPVFKNKITFSKSEAERHYITLLGHTLRMFDNARNLKEKDAASQAYMSLMILPLRIH